MYCINRQINSSKSRVHFFNYLLLSKGEMKLHFFNGTTSEVP